MTSHRESRESVVDAERSETLARFEEWIETPMQVLGFVWLGLLVLELTRGLSAVLAILSGTIWVIFIGEFLLRLALAPSKGAYLKRNWLVALSLFVPALRVLRLARAFRALRLVRAARGARLISIVSSVNRGMHALRETMGRRGFVYVLALTGVVVLVGAAGMQAFERDLPDGGGLNDYPTALWWTAMIITTLGSEYWPRTAEGRVLCLLLAVYSFAVWGYITASLATFFLDRDAGDRRAAIASERTLEALRDDISQMREEVRALRDARGFL